MATGHGGNLRELAQRAGLDRDQILDFSASINPLGPPDGLRAVLARSIDRLVHYPDPDCTELVELLARRHRRGRGADRRRQRLDGDSSLPWRGRLPFARAVIPVPSYIDYAAAVQAAGREVVLAEARGKRGLRPRLAGVGSGSFAATKSCCLASRTIPRAGRSTPMRSARWPPGIPTTTFVVDEAFADFIDGYRSLAERPAANVIVVRSLTKFYAIPGLRLGYAVASPAMAERIRSQILPWSVSVWRRRRRVALLADEEYARRSIALVGQQRQPAGRGIDETARAARLSQRRRTSSWSDWIGAT